MLIHPFWFDDKIIYSVFGVDTPFVQFCESIPTFATSIKTAATELEGIKETKFASNASYATTVAEKIAQFMNAGSSYDNVKFRLYTYKSERRIAPIYPHMVSIIDDDTSSTLFVQRFRDTCLRNGIVGNYAVATRRLERGDTNADVLLECQDMGFGLLVHCYYQSGSNPPWNDPVRDTDIQNTLRANLIKGIQQMREFGFVNYDHWVYPNGVYTHRNQELARTLGMRCGYTVITGFNSLYHRDKYIIFRTGLSPNGDGSTNIDSVKQVCDEFFESDGGWLLITTHYNVRYWDNVGYNETIDETGYPIGYRPVNELIQYIKSKGGKFMSLPDAYSYMEPYFDLNNEEVRSVAKE